MGSQSQGSVQLVKAFVKEKPDWGAMEWTSHRVSRKQDCKMIENIRTLRHDLMEVLPYEDDKPLEKVFKFETKSAAVYVRRPPACLLLSEGRRAPLACHAHVWMLWSAMLEDSIAFETRREGVVMLARVDQRARGEWRVTAK